MQVKAIFFVNLLFLTVVSFHTFVASLTLFSKQEETFLEIGKNLTVLPIVPKEYVVLFEVKPLSFKSEWQNIIHMTPGENLGYAERNSAFFIDSQGILFVMSPVNGTTLSTETTFLPLMSWTEVNVSQILVGGNFIYTISLNKTIIFTTVNYDAQNFSNVILYAADLWYTVQDGLIRHLSISQPIESLLVYESQLNIIYSGILKSKLLTLNLSLKPGSKTSLVVFNLTIKYFFPLFFANISSNAKTNFLKIDCLHSKYMWVGSLTANDSILHAINATLGISKIPINGMLYMEIPVEISYTNFAGKRWTQYKKFHKEISSYKYHAKKNLIGPLPESYGRGIYWDKINSHIYVCMNQHVSNTKSACYYSNNLGLFWADLDIRIGSILGHHSITSELHAIHRNQKTYLIFKNIYKEWFALTNKDFSEYSAKYIDPSMRNKLEGDDDQVFTLGPNQWKGNADGIFYRKVSNDSWVQRIKWNI